MLMVKAGDVVDKFINDLVPLLDKGDIIIDGGNSLYTDSNRRTKDLVCFCFYSFFFFFLLIF